MKKFIVALLALGMSSAFAAEIQIMEAALPTISTYRSEVDARFQTDKTTGEASVVVTVTEMRWTTYGGHCPTWSQGCEPRQVSVPVVVMRESVKVEGLALHGNQVIYQGAEGDVNCGRLGQSSILRRPTIFLTGSCKLSGRVVGNGHNARVNVKMITK